MKLSKELEDFFEKCLYHPKHDMNRLDKGRWIISSDEAESIKHTIDVLKDCEL